MNAQTAETPKKPAPNAKPSFQLKVYSPFRTYFEGPAYSISAENDTGPFDILAHHKNFITLLNPCTMAIKTPDTDKYIRIAKGVMHVKSDQVIVFLDI